MYPQFLEELAIIIGSVGRLPAGLGIWVRGMIQRKQLFVIL